MCKVLEIMTDHLDGQLCECKDISSSVPLPGRFFLSVMCTFICTIPTRYNHLRSHLEILNTCRVQFILGKLFSPRTRRYNNNVGRTKTDHQTR